MKGLLDRDRSQLLAQLCQKLDAEFLDLKLLHQALTHTSFANETKHNLVVHNERLEFLGDAVLELVISEYLFQHFQHFSEGELTKARAQIVCEPTLARQATELELGKYLLLGKGEENSGGRERNSILADAFEAVIGAIYTDQGFAAAKRFILTQLKTVLNAISRGESVRDFKTLLQEYIQRSGETRIAYEVIREHGPDHDKVFEVVVVVAAERLGGGIGRSKKEAEQAAAKEALIRLKVI
ncbi:MAG: ribonuclease III [Negativicutes bacterium]|nr:ribonuclease III [Negativicutes bacterium]